ncbi:adenylate/guanylate cyclase domain-containing protein [Caenimonas sedimenti]|nr:adenylate/guanylate cyclase domain-containing protein [Caenimonas sedimenti]
MKDAWRAWSWRLGLTVLLWALVQWLPGWEALQRLEYDTLASFTAPPPPAAPVVVIGIDEPSLAALGMAPPLPRQLHAQVVDSVAAAGARAIAIDLLFSAAQDAENDATLARALRGRLPVVVASAETAVQSSQVARYSQKVESIYPQARHGSAAMPRDEDGVVRRAPAEADALWRVLADSASQAVRPPPPGALLRYYAPEVPITYVHYSQALDARRSLRPDALRGALVLLGQNTPVGGIDQIQVPLRILGTGAMSGVFVHATALINGLRGDWIVPAHSAGPLLQALLAMAAAAALTRRWRGGRAMALTVALAALSVLATVVLFIDGTWWSALPVLAGLAIHFNVGAADSYLRERRRRERLRLDFASYVPSTVVDALAGELVPLRTTGERRVLTLLFSDLAGFTTASEQLPPEQVATVLNAYFTRMTAAVHQHGGTLDKFIGDAVMAFWNAPLPEPAHAERALACAREMQREMETLRASWQGTPFAGIRLRIGLHTGEAAVGNLGSAARFTYTAVGDTVNTAARLEAANKQLGTDILLSKATHDALPEAMRRELRPLGPAELPGRAATIEVYTEGA